MKQKRGKNKKLPQPKKASTRGINIDVCHIQEQLIEQEAIRGGYCQDFETFKSTYRFMKRHFSRIDGNACTILFTLTDGKGNLSPLHERGQQMAILAEQIQCSLRCGDVFTQYSSGQFLVMVLDVVEDMAEQVAARIHNAFYKARDLKNNDLLSHHCFSM